MKVTERAVAIKRAKRALKALSDHSDTGQRNSARPANASTTACDSATLTQCGRRYWPPRPPRPPSMECRKMTNQSNAERAAGSHPETEDALPNHADHDGRHEHELNPTARVGDHT